MSHFLSTFWATFCYTGYAPKAPGTAGSLAAVVVLWWLPALAPLALSAAAATVFLTGIPAATRVAIRAGREDPGIVVIDEVAGMLITLIAVPKIWWLYGLGFLLFRLFDIVKPWPCRRLEDAPGGWGIMLDDAGAGLYACMVLQIVMKVF